ncbi:MAG: TonB-dependent receptor [Bacteroidota bacterium]
MKISILLLLTGLLSIYAGSAYSQETKLSLDLKESSVGEALAKIEEQSEFYFLFSNKLIDVERKVSIQVSEKPISTVLDELFSGTDVRYVVMDRQIILSTEKILVKKSDREKLQRQDQIKISGNITDQNGEPLPGVNVTIQGTHKGTISDISGNYEIFVDGPDAVLEFSYVGFLTQEITVGRRVAINIQLEEDIHGIDEVVIVGFGTQKKVNVTGAVDVVSGDELENRPAENMAQLLQGTSPNLNISVSQDGGEPGAGQHWNIRGIGTINGSSSPLILVDGVEMDVNSLNPESIESVSVLKDAAASAIYGARAPFGVVLITTKQGGKNEKIRLSYNNNFGFASPLNLPEFESSLILATAFNQACEYTGISHKFPDEQMDRIRGYMDGTYLPEYDTAAPPDYMWAGRHQGNANYEYIHMYWRENAPRIKHDVSLSGGGDKTQYFISAGTYDQAGLYNYGYDSYKRNNLMANITSRVTDWMSIDFRYKYSQINTDYPLGTMWLNRYYMLKSMETFWPTQPMYNYGVDQSDDLLAINNPTVRLMQGAGRDQTVKNDSWITLATEMEPVKGWKTNISYNYNYYSSRNTTNPIPVDVHFPNGDVGNIGQEPSGYTDQFKNKTYAILYATSSYERTLGGHFLKAMIGYEQELENYARLSGSKTELITLSVPSINTALGEVLLSEGMDHWSTQALFSRFSYNYKEKYLLEFNARYNGSSRFGTGLRWGFFPSASAGYNIAREDFWASFKPVVNRLKIRGSYGSLGNHNVQNYLHMPNMTLGINHDWVMGGSNIRPNWAAPPGIPSKHLTWETVTTSNIGIDAGFLENRLDVTVDIFSRRTANMWGPAESRPAVLGTGLPDENNADLRTRGWELAITWREARSADFNYNVKVMVGDNRTTILKYNNDAGLIDDWYTGQEIGEIWGYTTDGIMQEDGEEMPDQSKFWNDWGAGDMKYVDIDGNDTINDGNRTLDNHGDLSIIGNSLPRYNIAISLGANWKGFDFNMFWQGIGKHEYMKSFNWDGSRFWGIVWDPNHSTIFKGGQHLDYWRPADETNILGPNTDAYFPKPYFSEEIYKSRQDQTRYLVNAAYLRLKSVQIGYTIPVQFTHRVHVQKLRIYFSGENLLTFTPLTKLLDPETATAPLTDAGRRWQAERAYPLSRVLSFGLNVTF